jgi:hypothetical protein
LSIVLSVEIDLGRLVPSSLYLPSSFPFSYFPFGVEKAEGEGAKLSPAARLLALTLASLLTAGNVVLERFVDCIFSRLPAPLRIFKELLVLIRINRDCSCFFHSKLVDLVKPEYCAFPFRRAETPAHFYSPNYSPFPAD